MKRIKVNWIRIFSFSESERKLVVSKPFPNLIGSVAEPEPAGAGTFWPEPVRRTGSGSTIDEKLNFKNVPQKFTEDTTCKYWYCR